jgi:hypothetical protein
VNVFRYSESSLNILLKVSILQISGEIVEIIHEAGLIN